MDQATTNQTLGIGSRVKHPAYGDGVVIRIHKAAYEVCFHTYGIKNVGLHYDKWDIIEAIEAPPELDFSIIEKSMMKVLQHFSDVSQVVPLGDKWEGGMMTLTPGADGLKNKEIPIENFFHKIVMVRDRLRVMEQRINASKNLSDEEKINLQQYITRIYGSLTTFNVLFKHKADYFVGEKTK